MINNKEIMAIILARGGSKAIPGKNIRNLRGKPLIAYTIEAALESKYIDRVVLSTDDKMIARTGKDCGAEVPFLRPGKYATDDSPSNASIIHALEWLKREEGYQPDYIVLLQPTSPLRKSVDIDNSIIKMTNHKADSLVSVTKSSESPYWMKVINQEGYLMSFIKTRKEFKRRQDLPDVYSLNGAIYICKRKLFLQTGNFYGEKTLPYVMPAERSVDIDNMLDWKLVELILEEKDND